MILLQRPSVQMTVGCSGSGKTTWARQLAMHDPRLVLISLDDFRFMLCGSKRNYWEGDTNRARNESVRTIMHDLHLNSLESALRYGLSVVVHNTHLRPSSFVREWQLCQSLGLSPRLHVFDLPLEDLHAINDSRVKDDRIPRDTLKAQYAAFSDKTAWWRFEPHVVHRG